VSVEEEVSETSKAQVGIKAKWQSEHALLEEPRDPLFASGASAGEVVLMAIKLPSLCLLVDHLEGCF